MTDAGAAMRCQRLVPAVPACARLAACARGVPPSDGQRPTSLLRRLGSQVISWWQIEGLL
jgi:hypothetical protein